MMTVGKIYNLTHRCLLRLKGNDMMQFLQGLITNDVRRLADGIDNAQYALMLNHRGRIVEDLILYRQRPQQQHSLNNDNDGDELLLESDRKNQPKLRKLLEMYKMHKDVTIDEANCSIYHADNELIVNDGIADPRVPTFGKRILSETVPEGEILDANAYRERRFDFGIPEGPSELADELPLFMNADMMNGVSANKGCYLGQELTARALNAPEIRKRLLPFTCSATVSGQLISSDGRREGKIIACSSKKGLALVPFSRDNFRTHFKTKDGNEIEVFVPSWWPKTDRDSITSRLTG